MAEDNNDNIEHAESEVAPEKKEYVIPTHRSPVIVQLENNKFPTLPRNDVVCVTCKHGIWRINREKDRYGMEDSERLECYCKHLFQVTYISNEFPYEVTACDSHDNSLPEPK